MCEKSCVKQVQDEQKIGEPKSRPELAGQIAQSRARALSGTLAHTHGRQ